MHVASMACRGGYGHKDPRHGQEYGSKASMRSCARLCCGSDWTPTRGTYITTPRCSDSVGLQEERNTASVILIPWLAMAATYQVRYVSKVREYQTQGLWRAMLRHML